MSAESLLPLAAGRVVCVAWSAKSNIVAIGHADGAEQASSVLLLEPASPRDAVKLQVPLAGELRACSRCGRC